MGSSGDTTVPSGRDVAARIRSSLGDAPALVIAWSAREPHRVGECALLEGAGPWWIGRDGAGSKATSFGRYRPGSTLMTGRLVGESVSRGQLELTRTSEGVVVKNVGPHARLAINGVELAGALLEEGDVVEIVGHYVFRFGTRPRSMGEAVDWPAFAFGEADAFGIVGESPAAWKLRADIAFAARTHLHVLLRGGSGTGKELAAAAIHALSRRARGPFVARSAATFPPGLVDAELFGNARNYPNAGMPEREGLVGAADGGTLFLDEIGETPLDAQAHLLRVLDGGEYHRLGDTRARRADFRLVCATNRDVAELKVDLAARLKLVIEIPALDARRDDIPLIARHLVAGATETSPAASKFVTRGARVELAIDPALVVTLLGASYPTNVRQLEAILWRAMRDSPEPPLTLAHAEAVAALDDEEDDHEYSEVELRTTLDRHAWNVSSASRALGITRHSLGRLMKKHALKKP